ncbi:virulence factor TspB C-terminal domain-related protein [Chromobacterium violaceum]|uniref:virulence factor TspB C-terminal domain-related protein n=1 Tax=Chromobacterium violaceum TaxID=536 RepID=UPI00385B3C3D
MWRATLLFWLFLALAGFCSVAVADPYGSLPQGGACFDDFGLADCGSILSRCSTYPDGVIVKTGSGGGQMTFNCQSSSSGGVYYHAVVRSGSSDPVNVTCPVGMYLNPDGITCGNKPTPPPCPSPDVMQITCQSMAGKHQKSGMITPTSGPGCDTGGGSPGMGQCGAGCEMTTRTVVTPTAAYFDHVYTGNYCKPDGTVGNPGDYVKVPPKNQACGNNQTYGEINGVPTCVDNAQKPGTQPPETTSPDSCPRGSVALISPTTGKPIACVDPKDPSKPCSDGQYSATVNGTTICMGSPDKPVPASPAGTGSSSGHAGGHSSSSGTTGSNGGKPGSGTGTGTKPGDASGSKPGDSSSPQPETCDDKFPSGLKWVCGLGAGLSGPDGSDKLTTQQGGDIGGMLDESDMFGGGSCPATRSVAVPVGDMTWNWDIDFSPFCRFVLLLRPGVIAVAMLTALFIIFKRG